MTRFGGVLTLAIALLASCSCATVLTDYANVVQAGANGARFAVNGQAAAGYATYNVAEAASLFMSSESVDFLVQFNTSAPAGSTMDLDRVTFVGGQHAMFSASITSATVIPLASAKVTLAFQCAQFDNGEYWTQVQLAFTTTAAGDTVAPVTFFLAKVCCNADAGVGNCRYNMMLSSADPLGLVTEAQQVVTNGAPKGYWNNHLTHFDDNDVFNGATADNVYAYFFYGWLANHTLVKETYGSGVPVSAVKTVNFTLEASVTPLPGQTKTDITVSTSSSSTQLQTFDPSSVNTTNNAGGFGRVAPQLAMITVKVKCPTDLSSRPAAENAALITVAVNFGQSQCGSGTDGACGKVEFSYSHVCTQQAQVISDEVNQVEITHTGFFAPALASNLYGVPASPNKFYELGHLSAPNSMFDDGWVNPAYASGLYHANVPYDPELPYLAPLASVPGYVSDLWFYTSAKGTWETELLTLHFPFNDVLSTGFASPYVDVEVGTECVVEDVVTLCKTHVIFLQNCYNTSEPAPPAKLGAPRPITDYCFIQDGAVTGVPITALESGQGTIEGMFLCKRCNKVVNLHIFATTDIVNPDPEDNLVASGYTVADPKLSQAEVTIDGEGEFPLGLYLGDYNVKTDEEQAFFTYSSYDVDMLSVGDPSVSTVRLGAGSFITALDEEQKVQTIATFNIACHATGVTKVLISIQPINGTETISSQVFVQGASIVPLWVDCVSTVAYRSVVADISRSKPSVAIEYPFTANERRPSFLSSSSGMSAAGVFFLVVFILLLVGCIGCAGAKYSMQGKRGWEVIPLIDFYRQTWGRCTDRSSHSRMATDDFEQVGVRQPNQSHGNNTGLMDSKAGGYGAL